MNSFVHFKNVLIFCLLPASCLAQETYWFQPDSLYKYVQPVASLQLWSVYTIGEQAQLTDNGPLENVQDRLNFLVRRARIGFKGKPYKKLSYTLTVQYDNLGKDRLGAVRGETNTGDLGILDAYITWRLTNNELISLTTGYFHPQFSRECITGDMLVNSFDKSPTQIYIRQHIVGKNYGRSTGLNTGGLFRVGSITLNYNAGLFNNNSTAAEDLTETTGKFWSPVMVDRLTFSLGDADMKSYTINYDVNNYFNQRKGITIGFNSSVQGRTDTFSSNRAAGADVLLNYRNLNLDGEWVIMQRIKEGSAFRSRAAHIRAGYNIIVARKFFIEPSFMIMQYNGDNGLQDFGEDRMVDIGINWYLNKKNCKLSAHYLMQDGYGDNGFTDGTTFRKGDFAAIGFVLIL